MSLRSEMERARDAKGTYHANQFMIDESAKENYEEMAMNIDGTISYLMELDQEYT